MQEGFPFKKQIIDRPLNIDMGGDGRYVYWLVTISSVVRLVCYDASLLTAANYAGTGTWTVSPFVAQINVSISPSQCVYVASRKEVWVFSTTQIQRVDANPNSATFNTIVGTTLSHTLGQPISAACYVPDYDTVLLSGITNNRIISCRTLSQTNTSFPFMIGVTDVNARYNLQINTFGHLLVGGTNTSSAQVLNYNLSPTTFGSYFNVFPFNGVTVVLKSDNLVTRSASVITFYKYISGQYQRIASLSTASTILTNRIGYINNIGKWYLPNGNNIGVVNMQPTISVGANIAKAFTAAGEVNCGFIYTCDKDRIAIVQAVGATGYNHFHVIDVASETYIGYVVMTGTYDSANPSITQFISCKNQLEI